MNKVPGYDAIGQAVFDAAGVGMVLFDDQLLIARANRRFCEIVGRRRPEIVGDSCTTFTHPDDLAENQRVIGDVSSGAAERETLEKRYVRPDGSIVWAHVTVTALERDGVGRATFLLATVEDVTETVEQGRLTELIATGAPLDRCLIEITAAIERLCPGLRSAVLVADRHRRVFEAGFSAELSASFVEGILGATIEELAIGTCGTAVFTGQPVECTDIERDPRWAPEWRAHMLAHGVAACFSQPVPAPDGCSSASLVICLDEAREINLRERQLVRFGMQLAALAIEHDRAADRVRENEARLRSVLDGMAEGHAYLAPDFTILDINAEGLRLDTRPRDEIVGRTHWEAFPGSEDLELGRVYKRVMAERVPASLEHRYEWEDGRVTWLEMRAYPAGEGLALFWRDVTERKQAEERLQESDARLRDALDGGRMLAWEWNIAEGYVHRVEGEVPVIGLGSGPAHGFLERIHPDDRETQLELLRAVAAGEAEYESEFRIILPDGGIIWVADRARVERDCDGRPVRMAGVLADITARREVEERLRESEARYRQIVEGADDFAIVTLDDHGIITGWNTGAERIVGFTRDEAIGQSGAIIFTREDRERGAHEREIERATEDERAVNERWHVRKDGARFWASGMMMRLTGERGGYLKMFRDRTIEHDAEARLSDSEARYRAVFEQAGVGVARVSPDGPFLEINDRYCEILGRSRDELIGGEWKEITHADDLAEDIGHVDRLLRGEADSFTMEKRYVAKDGGDIWVNLTVALVRDEAGAPGFFVAVAEDIARRKQAEERLHESARQLLAREAELRRLNEELEERVVAAVAERNRLWAVSEDLFATAGPDGYLVEVSDSWTRVLGWSQEELLIRPFWDIIHPDDIAHTIEQLNLLRKGSRAVRYENRVKMKAGSWRVIAWTLSQETELGRHYAVGRDVTVEREQAVALARAQDQLFEAQKMETIGQLTGGVAHDFNNLLTPIMAGLDMLARKLPTDDARAQRMVAGAMQSAERSKTLVQRLLAFARRQTLQPKAVDPAMLVTGMGELIERSLGPTIAVAIDVPHRLPTILIDPTQLELAILNVCVNARDAMPDGGAILIEGRAEQVATGEVPGLAEGRYVRLSVADTGCGMDTETLQRAVEPFYTTKDVGRGTGLGLSMVHGLAAQSGGAFQLTSEIGIGTTVALWLPLSDAPAASTIDGGENDTIETRAARLLLVDDEELVRVATADSLREFGYEVTEAASAAHALSQVRDGLRPDLVVTDHMMPGMTGAQLANELRALVPDVPVLLITGYANLRPDELNDLPVLAKPFRMTDLVARVEALLEVV